MWGGNGGRQKNERTLQPGALETDPAITADYHRVGSGSGAKRCEEAFTVTSGYSQWRPSESSVLKPQQSSWPGKKFSGFLSEQNRDFSIWEVEAGGSQQVEACLGGRESEHLHLKEKGV